ncbi:MAG TPA: hypothetical protein VM370_09315 [Candidatus Thermoplasmatota archaeon]|nr:hypothetical protein [Candidatus Thermoplasmatota archaeon]
MRTNTILTTFLAAALLTVAVGAALAQPGGDGARSERAAAMAELREARNASIAEFKVNRSAALADFHAANNATRASFLENKTLVIDGCRAQRNATEDDNNSDYAKCVSDGLKPLIESARAAHKAAREAAQAKLEAARETAKAAFLARREAIRAQHQPSPTP